MVILIEKISEALDRGNCVIGVFIDFSKAFDTVDHKILLQKTRNVWYQKYLTKMVWELSYRKDSICNR